MLQVAQTIHVLVLSNFSWPTPKLKINARPDQMPHSARENVLGFANTGLLELVECANRKAQHSTIFPMLTFEPLVAE